MKLLIFTLLFIGAAAYDNTTFEVNHVSKIDHLHFDGNSISVELVLRDYEYKAWEISSDTVEVFLSDIEIEFSEPGIVTGVKMMTGNIPVFRIAVEPGETIVRYNKHKIFVSEKIWIVFHSSQIFKGLSYTISYTETIAHNINYTDIHKYGYFFGGLLIIVKLIFMGIALVLGFIAFIYALYTYMKIVDLFR